jgi:LemA protein
VVGVHNRLIRLRNGITVAHALLDLQLKRRYALVAQWVEAAQGYFSDATALLESTTAANLQASAAADALRSRPASAAAMHALQLAEKVLEAALGLMRERLSADTLHAAYLAVDQSLCDCGADLAATDSALDFAKAGYNKAVSSYNAAIAQFPATVLANITGRQRAAKWVS